MILIGKSFKNGEAKGIKFDKNGESRVGKYSKEFLDELKRFGIVPKTGVDADVLESEKPPVVKTETRAAVKPADKTDKKEAGNEVAGKKGDDVQKKPEKAEKEK